ncbi:MAG TPA: hypothetical protein VIQ74_04220, partial [Gemmatimonadaceae bacterium]
MTFVSRERRNTAIRALAIGVALPFGASQLAAQYPLSPSPVVNINRVQSKPHFSGYVSVRGVRSNDSTTLSVNRGRVTVVTAPLPYLAVRLQGDVSGRLRSDGTTSSFTLTDAYIELAPPSPSRSPSISASPSPSRRPTSWL